MRNLAVYRVPGIGLGGRTAVTWAVTYAPRLSHMPKYSAAAARDREDFIPGEDNSSSRSMPFTVACRHPLSCSGGKTGKRRGRGRVPERRVALCTLCDHFRVCYRPVCGAGECAKWTRDVHVTSEARFARRPPGDALRASHVGRAPDARAFTPGSPRCGCRDARDDAHHGPCGRRRLPSRLSLARANRGKRADFDRGDRR